MKHIACVFVFSAVALLGCSKLVVKKIDPVSDVDGLRYSLQIPKVRIIYYEKAVYDGPDPKKPRVVAEAKAEVVTIPDPTRTYVINLENGWFSADAFGITYADNGAISTYNATADDQTATVVTELGRIALAGAALAASPASEKIQRRPPLDGTATVDNTDRILLQAAIKRVNLLQTRIDQQDCIKNNSGKPDDELKKVCSPLTKDEREELTGLLAAISALQAHLFKATEVVGTKYINLRFVPDDHTSPDEFVLSNAVAWRGSERSVIVAVAKRVP